MRTERCLRAQGCTRGTRHDNGEVTLLSWIVVGLFIAVTALAATRLLLLYRETRGLPELLIATLILGVGTFGVGGSFVILSTVPGVLSPRSCR